MPFLVLMLAAMPAQAAPAAEIAVTWRPTIQAITAMSGKDPRDTMTVILEGSDTLVLPQLGRGEVAAWIPLAELGGLYANVQGGTYALRLARDADVQRGIDGLAGAGGWIEAPLGGIVSVRTRLGGRVYAWAIEDVPTHGNLGLVLGVDPRIGPVSFMVEGTLAAIGALDDPDVGAQRDASSLRLRAAYGLAVGEQRIDLGAEMFHTKTEFSGSSAVRGETCLALDDLQVAVTLGMALRP